MIENPNVKTNNLNEKNLFCQKCKGRLYVRDSKIRQKATLQKFGKVPNPCVDDNNGRSRCPFVKS